MPPSEGSDSPFSMKPTPPAFPRDPAKDPAAAYDKLPARTKELLKLEEQITKTTGQESAALQKKARAKSR